MEAVEESGSIKMVAFDRVLPIAALLLALLAPQPLAAPQPPNPLPPPVLPLSRQRIEQVALLSEPAASAEPCAVSTLATAKGAVSAGTVAVRELRYRAIIEAAARRHRVEPALVQAVIMVESTYDPQAVSHRGAAGLMQLMPQTAAALGVNDRFDPTENVEGGVRYLRKLLDRFEGDTRLALAAYNAGSRKVYRYQGVPPFKATQAFIRKVLHYYRHYSAARGEPAAEAAS